MISRRTRTTTPGSSSPRAPPAVPKGVAVTHRSAAAFVDAEARLFLRTPRSARAIGSSPGSRSPSTPPARRCGWPGGTAPASSPRRGHSCAAASISAPGWSSQRITVVSTVPTLAALWPQESLDAVRLLIFGGEACPPELAERLTDEGREVWNTYGPTEATVVACAARLQESEPVRIGLPLDGWDLAVVDGAGHPVPTGRARPAGHRRRRARPATSTPSRTRRSTRRCRPSAGRAPTAPGISCAPTRTGWSSSGARTSRSSSAAGASSWARSMTPCCASARGGRRRRPRCGPARAGNQLLVGYVVPADACRLRPHRSVAPPARRTARGARAGDRRRSTSCRPGRRARSTATRCPGRWRAWTRRGAGTRPYRHRGVARRAVGGRPGHAGDRPRRRLLRARWRQSRRRPPRLAGARPLSAADRRRRVRPPPHRRPGEAARRDDSGRGAGAGARGTAHSAARASGAGGDHRGGGHDHRPAMAHAARRREQPARTGPPAVVGADAVVVVGARRRARPGEPLRPDGTGRGVRQAAAARCPAGGAPARRLGAHAAVVGRTARRCRRGREPGRCAVDRRVRPRAGRHRGSRRRPAHHCRRSPD